MAVQDHSAWQQETQRLDYTLGYIHNTTLTHLQRKEKVDYTVRDTLRHFDSSNSENYITLMINTLLKDRMDLLLKNLVKARSKPYFARVDFHEEGAGAPEVLYIGKMSLIRDEDQEVIIVDWRAPAANLYYEERLGGSSYHCPEGTIRGELLLKRQFSIEQGELLNIMDIDITTNDEFLQSYLGANADERLKEIVSTIQTEQNHVIRADMWNPLIVQGAAGSGKTTIALHRIAYLIYTYEKTFRPENFMIIAPNRLFLNYISEVLPELGVERVKQTTFIDFAQECIGRKLKIQDPNDKLAVLINTPVDADRREQIERIKESTAFKSSMAFKELLDRYLTWLEEDYLPAGDITIAGYILYTREEIRNLFLVDFRDLPFKKRIKRIEKVLQHRARKDKDILIARLQRECDHDLMQLKQVEADDALRRPRAAAIIDRKDRMIRLVENESRTAVKKHMAAVSSKTIFDYYRELFEDPILFRTLAEHCRMENSMEIFCTTTLKLLRQKFIEIEDLAPLIYLKLQLDGLPIKISIDHTVVDEAQDLSIFQLYVLRKITKGSSMTILGDLCQGIHDYRGTKDWGTLIESVFGGRCRYLTLKQSYRTTVEIMEAANSIMKPLTGTNIPLAQPVIRHGQPAAINQYQDLKGIMDALSQTISTYKETGYQSIAVIGKSLDECKAVYTVLRKTQPDAKLISGKEKDYPGGLVIIPVYLSKGLEFDAVLIANASQEAYPDDELHRKLLYVAMTRPLHRLMIYYYGRLTPILKEFAAITVAEAL